MGLACGLKLGWVFVCVCVCWLGVWVGHVCWWVGRVCSWVGGVGWGVVGCWWVGRVGWGVVGCVLVGWACLLGCG